MRCLILVLFVVVPFVFAQIKVDNTTKRFVDEYGRERIFHGVNAVFKTEPYMPITDYFDYELSLCESDMDDLYNWGMNTVRLGVMWPGVEPAKSQYDDYYLAKMAQIAKDLYAHGIYTIVDLHQDVYNRRECGEGVPDWATYARPDAAPFPAPVKDIILEYDPETGYPTIESCVLYDFFQYYFTEETGAVFQSLYDNTNGIQTSFINFWVKVASYFKDIDGVLGYELINEPWAGDVFKNPDLFLPTFADRLNLAPMYAATHDAIRQYDDKRMIFFEKATVNILGPTGLSSGPGGTNYSDRQVYSYHNYCASVDEQGNPQKLLICNGEEAIQWFQEMQDIKNLGCGGFLTEFGAVSGNSTVVLDNLNYLLDLTYKDAQSWCYWQFKKYNDFTTVNAAEAFYDADGNLEMDKIKALTRAYPQAIAGHLNSMNFDITYNKLTLEYIMDKAITQPTDIYANMAMNYPKGVKVAITPTTAADYKIIGNHIFITPAVGSTTGTTVTVTVSPAV